VTEPIFRDSSRQDEIFSPTLEVTMIKGSARDVGQGLISRDISFEHISGTPVKHSEQMGKMSSRKLLEDITIEAREISNI